MEKYKKLLTQNSDAKNGKTQSKKKVLIIHKLDYTFRNYTKNHSWVTFTDMDKLCLQIYKEERTKGQEKTGNFEKGKSEVYYMMIKRLI